MNIGTTIGYLAAFLTTIAFLPQTIKTIREKKAEGVSLIMYTLFNFGLLGWIIYGFYTGSLPVILANIITFIFSFIIWVLKLRYR